MTERLRRWGLSGGASFRETARTVWRGTPLGAVLLLGLCVSVHAQTPSIPDIPEMEAFHLLAPQLLAGLQASDTQAVQEVLTDIVPQSLELPRALVYSLNRVQAAPPADAFASGSLEDSLVLSRLVSEANRARREAMYYSHAWARTMYASVHGPALENLTSVMALDAELATRMSAALGNLAGGSVPAGLYIRMETDPDLVAGATYAIRVYVANVGDVPAENVRLSFSKATNMGGGESEIELGTIGGQSEKLHLFLVTAPENTELTAVRLTAEGDNVFPAIRIEPLMVYTNAP